LPALGMLIIRMMQDMQVIPRRISFTQSDTEVVSDNAHMTFDTNLLCDGMGRMGFSVSKSIPALNESCRSVGYSSFYGRMLQKVPTDSQCIYIVMNPEGVFSSDEPISLTHYASTYVPVEVRCSDSFRELTGHKSETAVVRVVSDLDDDNLKAFMRFYGIFDKKNVIASVNPAYARYNSDKVLVFRHDKSYIVTPAWVAERYKCES